MTELEKPRELTAEEKAQQESFKLLFEVYKHITTLSSGTIVILATFIEKLFKAPRASYLIPFSAVCFMLSIIVSLILMAHISIAQQIFHSEGAFERKIRSVLYVLAPIAFILGMVCLAALTLLNL